MSKDKYRFYTPKKFARMLSIGGQSQESTDFAWWAGNARLINF